MYSYCTEFSFTLKDIWLLPLTSGDYLLWNAMPDRSIWPQQIKADIDQDWKTNDVVQIRALGSKISLEM